MNNLSWLFNMSAGEEEEHGYEAIINAWQRLWQISRVHWQIPWSLQPLTGTHRNSLKIFGSSLRGWRAGRHSKVYLTRLVIEHDWSICSISWVPSDEGSTPLAQLQRNERRIRRVPSSLWSFYIAPWITLCPNDAGYTNWKRLGSKLAKHQTNLLKESYH